MLHSMVSMYASNTMIVVFVQFWMFVSAKKSISYSAYAQKKFQCFFLRKGKQAGTGPSRRHIQGSKIAKRLPSVKYSFTVLENQNFLKKKFLKKLHTQKNVPNGAPGLARASPWRAKVSQCRKTERGDPLRFFNIHSVAKHQKIAGGTLWGKFFSKKKSRSAEKNERGESLVSPGIEVTRKNRKNLFGSVR